MTDRQLLAVIRKLGLRRWYAATLKSTGLTVALWGYMGKTWVKVSVPGR